MENKFKGIRIIFAAIIILLFSGINVKASIVGPKGVLNDKINSLKAASNQPQTGIIEDANIKGSLGSEAGNSSKYVINPDINLDLEVNILDLAKMAKGYNYKSGSSGYSSSYDFNADGIIDIYDLSLMSKRMGITYNVSSISMTAYIGDAFAMPGALEVSLPDGRITKLNVNWTTSTVDTSSVKTSTVTGQLTDYGKSISSTVNVVKRAPQGANIVNLGLTSLYNNKVYYANPTNGLKLSKCDPDGSNVVKISDDAAAYINVSDGWIYYVNPNDNNSINKIRIDGTQKTKISSDTAEYINVSSGWIYYSNRSDNYTLYKISTSGSGRTKLNDLVSLFVSVYGDNVYYCDYTDPYADDYGNLYRVKKDGTGVTRLIKYEIIQYTELDNYLYVIDKDGRFGKYNLSATSGGMDYGLNANSLNTDGRYVYVSGDKQIYQYDTTTSSFTTQKTTPFQSEFINMTGSSMVYLNNSNENFLYLGAKDTFQPKEFGVDNVLMYLKVPDTDTAYQYDAFALPLYAKSYRMDGSRILLPITWNVDKVDTTKIGSFDFVGTVAEYPQKVSTTIKVVERGNSNQNLLNGGEFSQKGEWVYFTYPGDNKFYKEKLDGTQRTKLSDDAAALINIIGDNVYYKNKTTGRIIAMKSDGSSKREITADACDEFIADSDRLYMRMGNIIYTCNLDGSSTKELINTGSLNVSIKKMMLYWGDLGYAVSDGRFFEIAADGTSQPIKVLENVDATNYRMITDGRYIHYYNNHYNSPYVIDLATGSNTANDKFGLFENYNFATFNGSIYVASPGSVRIIGNDNNTLYKVNGTLYSSPGGIFIFSSTDYKIYKTKFDLTELSSFGFETTIAGDFGQTVYVNKGFNYTLPQKIKVMMIDGSAIETQITWDNNSVDTSAAGTYSFEGSVPGYTNKYVLKLIVQDEAVTMQSAEVPRAVIAVKSGQWIVYKKTDGIYRMNSDGTSKLKLSNFSGDCLTAYGDWIYYIDRNNGIRRVKIDGTMDSLVLTGKNLNTFQIENGWIYYLSEKCVWKARLDGTEVTYFFDETYDFVINNSVIYYYHISYDSYFHKVNIDGTGRTALPVSTPLEGLLYYNGYLYYNSSGSVKRVTTDGTNQVNDICSTNRNYSVYNNQMYSILGGGYLYKSNLDGSGGTTLKVTIGTTNLKFNIVDSWIYTPDGYRTKLDGSAKEQL